VQINAFAQEPLFSGASGIAGEQHSKLMILQDKGDGVVVDRVSTADEWQLWANEKQRHGVIGAPNHARPRKDNRHAVRLCRVETIVIGMTAIRLPAVGNLRDANLVQDWPTTADVIS